MTDMSVILTADLGVWLMMCYFPKRLTRQPFWEVKNYNIVILLKKI